jgi:hypothetical protein
MYSKNHSTSPHPDVKKSILKNPFANSGYISNCSRFVETQTGAGDSQHPNEKANP